MLRVYLPPLVNPESCLLCGQAFLLTIKSDHIMESGSLELKTGTTDFIKPQVSIVPALSPRIRRPAF